MAVSAARVTVGTSAVALNTAGPGGTTLIVKNGPTNIINLGPSTVTTANGFELAADASVSVDLDSGDVLFAVAGVASQPVQVLRT